jgi:16S rRNA (cytidine1402-2'-O)-methyltransferase
MSAALYIVSTPIGNLKDITYRAVETLKTTPVILAEDTRKASILFRAYDIQPEKVISYHSKNEPQRIQRVMETLESGTSVALISEAGTPLISDPGFLLVREAVKREIPIIPIPGATALTTLLPASGFPLGSFYFGGFLSPKSGRQKNQLAKLKDWKTVLVFYESPHRILKTLNSMAEVFGEDKEVVVGRELTKKFEEIIRGSLGEVIQQGNFVIKGEFCIILKND